MTRSTGWTWTMSRRAWSTARDAFHELRTTGRVLIDQSGPSGSPRVVGDHELLIVVKPRGDREPVDFTELIDQSGVDGMDAVIGVWYEEMEQETVPSPFAALAVWARPEGFFASQVHLYADPCVARDMAQFNGSRALLVSKGLNWGTALFA